jgi:hypothetical protein
MTDPLSGSRLRFRLPLRIGIRNPIRREPEPDREAAAAGAGSGIGSGERGSGLPLRLPCPQAVVPPLTRPLMHPLSAALLTSERREPMLRAVNVFTLKQHGASLAGKVRVEVNGETREVDLKEGNVEGDTVSFVEPLSIRGNELRVTSTGKLSADEIKLTRRVGNFSCVHAYLKEKNVPHIWHVDEHNHDFQHWKKALYRFSRLIFKADSK